MSTNPHVVCEPIIRMSGKNIAKIVRLDTIDISLFSDASLELSYHHFHQFKKKAEAKREIRS
jgi:hypothetical protein